MNSTTGYLQLLCLLFAGQIVWCFSIHSKTDISANCDRLFQNFINLRDAISQDPSFETEGRPLIVGIDVQDVSLLLGVESNNDESWRNLACGIAEADDIYDLSNLLGLPVEVIRSTLLEDMMQFYERMNPRLRGYQNALLSLASWANGSGFPERWPLRSTWKRTYSVIQNAKKFNLAPLVAFGAPRFTSARAITSALLVSTSLEGFLRRIGSNEILTTPTTLARLLETSKKVISPEGAQAKINTLRAGLDLVHTLDEIGIMKMVNDY